MTAEWQAQPTGNMTISLVAPDGSKVLGLDLLGAGSLQAETGGDRLVRDLRNLEILATALNLMDQPSGRSDAVSSEGTSPRPWTLMQTGSGICVRDADGRTIARKRRLPRQWVARYLRLIKESIAIVNCVPQSNPVNGEMPGRVS